MTPTSGIEVIHTDLSRRCAALPSIAMTEKRGGDRPIKWYTMPEVAEHFRLGDGMREPERYLRRMIKKGKIPGSKVGRSWFMSEADIEAAATAFRFDAAEPAPSLAAPIDDAGIGRLSAGSLRRRVGGITAFGATRAQESRTSGGVEIWPQYVRRISKSLTQMQIAELTGLSQATVSSWLRGAPGLPNAVSVATFARAFNQPPVEALAAAGYLEINEATATARTPLFKYSDEELMGELLRRLQRGK